ncbi:MULTISPECIES: hypothetical protein [unclassified Kitasatospora]|uniref:hypothetical protein n=1 Tax=unclassified Kitasatospora TaxID=2633591 RepID=UPI0033FABD68
MSRPASRPGAGSAGWIGWSAFTRRRPARARPACPTSAAPHPGGESDDPTAVVTTTRRKPGAWISGANAGAFDHLVS